jgi:hypothetical protein
MRLWYTNGGTAGLQDRFPVAPERLCAMIGPKPVAYRVQDSYTERGLQLSREALAATERRPGRPTRPAGPQSPSTRPRATDARWSSSTLATGTINESRPEVSARALRRPGERNLPQAG